MSEGSNEKNQKFVSEGSGKEKIDSLEYYYDNSVCDPDPFTLI